MKYNFYLEGVENRWLIMGVCELSATFFALKTLPAKHQVSFWLTADQKKDTVCLWLATTHGGQPDDENLAPACFLSCLPRTIADSIF